MKTVIIFLTIFLIGCQEQHAPTLIKNVEDGVLIPTNRILRLSHGLDSLIREFIKQNELENIKGQIFIDEVSPGYSFILLTAYPYPGAESQFGNSPFTIRYGNNVFSLYSGWEDKIEKDTLIEIKNDKYSYGTQWQLIDSVGHVRYQRSFGIPFHPYVEMMYYNQKQK